MKTATKPKKEIQSENRRAEDKIKRFINIIDLLEIRKTHFGKLSDMRFFPMFLRAKYRMKAFELEADIIAKREFVKIYTERIKNVQYAERVMEPVPAVAGKSE